jgi:hypothetical protein
LEFNDAFDLTAIGTLALAVVTFIALLVARSTLKQTRREIDLSRREVEEAHRPVLVPTPMAQPTTVGDGGLAVHMTNIGTGPALHIEASASLLDAEGKPSLAPTGPQTPSLMAGLGAGEGSVLQIGQIGAMKWTSGVSFELTVLYRDVAGKAWETVGNYLDARGRYEGLNIQARPLDDWLEAATDRARR